MAKFVQFPEERDYPSFDRPKYLSFIEGKPLIIRILDEQAYAKRVHWINRQRISVLCLGDTCPICAQNTKIRKENPKNFRNIKGYLPYQNRYMVNVLDRTLIKVDEETGDEYVAIKGEFPTVTNDGNRSLANVTETPSNTIKLLERGKTLFEQFLALHMETGEFDADENLLSGGITSFDLKLVTMGENRDKVISTIPLVQNNDDVAPILVENELVPHVLSTIGLQLTPSEVDQVAYANVSLSDIFAQRRTEDEDKESEAEVRSLADASAGVQALFDKDKGEEELVSY